MSIYEQYEQLNSQISEIASFIAPYVKGVGDNRFASNTPKEVIEQDKKMIKLIRKSKELEFILLSM